MLSSKHKTTTLEKAALIDCLLVTPGTVPLHLAPGVPDPDQPEFSSSDSHLKMYLSIYVINVQIQRKDSQPVWVPYNRVLGSE